jgi:channel protein (hemolysin III family)
MVAADKRRLISFSELPDWSHDNEFIVSGYRAPGGTIDDLKARASGLAPTQKKNGNTTLKKRKSTKVLAQEIAEETIGSDIEEHDSFQRCIESVFLYAHNESVNIHTHLWGAVVAVLAIGLHVLGAYDSVPAWLYPITHHSIFYPQSIKSAASSSKLSSLASVFSRKSSAVAPLLLNAVINMPGYQDIFPHHHTYRLRANHISDWAGYASFLTGALTVFACSATFHTVSCHSQQVARSYNKLDYVGIVAMIVGSFLPMLHYGFYCHPRLQAAYMTMIVSLGAAATYTVLSKKFTSPAYRPIRTSVFLALGLSAIFPVAHIVAMYGYQIASRTMGLNFLIAGGALYVVGACLYMARVPERFSPGTFDYVGASHQIFHVLILLAAFCHYICLRRAHVFWHAVQAASTGASHDAFVQPLATRAVCLALDSLRHA